LEGVLLLLSLCPFFAILFFSPVFFLFLSLLLRVFLDVSEIPWVGSIFHGNWVYFHGGWLAGGCEFDCFSFQRFRFAWFI